MADYTVKAGDTLSRIAKAHNTTVEQICKDNGIKNANEIQIGQELSIGKTTADKPTEAPAQKAPDMSPEELSAKLAKEEKIAAQEKRIAELENEGLSDLLVRDLTDAYEWTEEKVDQGVEFAKDTYKKGKEAVKDAYEWTEEKVDQGVEFAKDTYKKGKEAVKDAYEWTEEKVDQGVEFAKDTYNKGKEAVKDAYEWTEEKVDQGVELAKDTYKKGKEAVKDAYEATVEFAEKVDDKFDNAVGKANQKVQGAIDKAQGARDRAYESVKFDIPEKTPVDTSKMTMEEREAYNEQRISELEDRSFFGMLGTSFKKAYNKGVDFMNDTGDKIIDAGARVIDLTAKTIKDPIGMGKKLWNKITNW